MAAIESAAATAAASTSVEDAAKKKTTDCVYFLASPLTCKKGAECEFRHSEAARINPRDCWYWLSTECWNRDCPFRHPPVDARPEPAPAQPLSTKARPPCYYYAQGYCAKAERCSFIHSASPAPMIHKSPPLVHREQIVKTQPAALEAPVKAAELKTAQATTQKQQVTVHTTPAADMHFTGMRKFEPAAQIARKPEPVAIQITRRPEPAATQITRKIEQAAPPVTRKLDPPAAQISRKLEAPAARKIEAPPKRNLQARKPSPEENRISSPEPLSSTHELEDEEETRGGTNFSNGDGGYKDRDENSPGFDVLVDDGPEEQLQYGEDGEFHEAGGRYDDDMDHEPFDFAYSEMYGRRGGGFDSPAAPYDRPGFGEHRVVVGEFEHRRPERFDRVDYDRPRFEQFDNLEREYFRKSSSIRDRLVFNGGGEGRAPFLGRNDLRNLLEKRRVDSRSQRELRRRDDNREQQVLQQQQQQQQRRLVHRLGGRRSQESVYTRIEQRRGVMSEPSPPPVLYEMNRSSPRAFESSDFAAPKSLAEIRAGKRKFDRGESPNGFSKRVQQQQQQQPQRERPAQEEGKFEGPKPLREILKEKQKVAVAEETPEAGYMAERSNGVSEMMAAEEGGSPMTDPPDNGADDLIDDDEDDDDFARKLGRFFT